MDIVSLLQYSILSHLYYIANMYGNKQLGVNKAGKRRHSDILSLLSLQFVFGLLTQYIGWQHGLNHLNNTS